MILKKNILSQIPYFEKIPKNKKIAKIFHNCLQYEKYLIFIRSNFEYCQILLNKIMQYCQLKNITKLKKEKKKKKSIDNIQYNTSITIEIKKKKS